MTQVLGHNGVRLHVRSAGNPANPPILLIHGWSQHSLCWRRQFEGLSDRFHLIAPDLRGHGQSDKPEDPEAYDNSAPWAGDIAAIIDQMGLEKPVLLGWSLGGWVVQDYVRLRGTAALSAIALVGTSVTTGTKTPDQVALKRDADVRAMGMLSDDQAENLAATLAFVRACTAAPLPAADFATMVGYNMLVPPQIRKWSRSRHEDYRPTMAALDIPTLVMWGTEERLALPPMIDEILATIPTAKPCPFDGLGHAPFYEDPIAFNTALAAFAERHMKVPA